MLIDNYDESRRMCVEPRYERPGAIRDITAERSHDRMYDLCDQRTRMFPDAESAVVNTERLEALGRYLVRAGSVDSDREDITIDKLLDCKIILGRFPSAKESKVIFPHAPIFGASVAVADQGAEGSVTRPNPGWASRTDDRVAALIGKRGQTLNGITRRSGCLYIWLDQTTNFPILQLYCSAMNRERARVKFEAALAMIDDLWASYASPKMQGRLRPASTRLQATSDIKEVAATRLFHKMLDQGSNPNTATNTAKASKVKTKASKAKSRKDVRA